jgi:hypothetical protein
MTKKDHGANSLMSSCQYKIRHNFGFYTNIHDYCQKQRQYTRQWGWIARNVLLCHSGNVSIQRAVQEGNVRGPCKMVVQEDHVSVRPSADGYNKCYSVIPEMLCPHKVILCDTKCPLLSHQPGYSSDIKSGTCCNSGYLGSGVEGE